MPEGRLTPSQENYLERIEELAPDGPVQVSDLAHRLGVKLPSVSRAVKGLRELGLVEHESYGSVYLTPHGETAAREVRRRRECLVELLSEVLAMPQDQSAAEADRLQHALSCDVLNRLEALVEFAQESDAWIKRLQLRIRKAEDSDSEKPSVIIGQSAMHAGSRKNGK